MTDKIEVEKLTSSYFVIHFRVRPSEFMKRSLQEALNLIAATKACAEGANAGTVGIILLVKNGQGEMLIGNPSGPIGEITAKVN